MRFSQILFGGVALAGAATLLTGCDKPAPAPSAASVPAAADSSPLPGIDPRAADAAGSGVPGPGAGATAVGGMAGTQESGGARKDSGASPAPTGGDGAASAPR